MEYEPTHFLDESITVSFETPPVREKLPPCPSGFTWRERGYRVEALLSEWSDFTRRGRMAHNMRPAHSAVAGGRGSLNVGRFFFRVKVDSGQVFDIYYDRAMKDLDHRKGEWFIYRELVEK